MLENPMARKKSVFPSLESNSTRSTDSIHMSNASRARRPSYYGCAGTPSITSIDNNLFYIQYAILLS